MTETILMLLIGTIPPTLTALAGLLVAIRNGQRTKDATIQATAAADHAATAVVRANTLVAGQIEIHGLVNSNLAQVKADLEDAKAEIVALRALVDTLTKGSDTRHG